MSLILLKPSREELPFYVSALKRGWSPNSTMDSLSLFELERIKADASAFLEEQDDPKGQGPPIHLPDGTVSPRLPGFRRWLWDGEFSGVISFRWQPGTTDLPPQCLGHVGYNVVPWKQGRGYASTALGLFLPEIQKTGLPFVELTVDPSNLASRRIIEKHGGQFVESFLKPPQFGNGEGLRYRIHF